MRHAAAGTYDAATATDGQQYLPPPGAAHCSRSETPCEDGSRLGLPVRCRTICSAPPRDHGTPFRDGLPWRSIGRSGVRNACIVRARAFPGRRLLPRHGRCSAS
jgi:hypothetical protein